MFNFFVILSFFISILAFTHDGKNRVKETVSNVALQKINDQYIKRIKPIFQKKCFDCHGSGNQLPWYSNIPGAKQLIQSDIEESKKHMDMSHDFPFLGHGTPEEDLIALKKMTNEESMPPFRYKLLHWNSSLTENEKKSLHEWIDKGLNTLNSQN